MIFKVKKFIVVSLEKACDLTRHKFCHKFAYASCVLDEKWNTCVWSDPYLDLEDFLNENYSKNEEN